MILKVFFNLTDSMICFLLMLTWSVLAFSHGVNPTKTNPFNQLQQIFVQTTFLVWLCHSDQLPKDCSLSPEALCTSFACSLWVDEGVWGLPGVHQHLPWKTTPATIRDCGCCLASAVQHRHSGFVKINLFLRFSPVQTSSIHFYSLQKVPSIIS